MTRPDCCCRTRLDHLRERWPYQLAHPVNPVARAPVPADALASTSAHRQWARV